MPGHFREAERFPLAGAFGLYTLAFLALAWPWLSGAVEIPYDAASQFYPQLAFLARSFATGQSPFWTPNIFAGWPQIADPQSLIFSPLHVIAALLVPNPSPWLADVLVFVLLYAGGAGVILFFRDRGWHVGGALVAALAFSFGGSAASRIQHIGQVESLVFLPLALWMLARALERSSWRAGAGAGVFAALIVLGRDQVSLIAVYVLVGFVFWHWLRGPDRRARLAASVKPLAAGAIAGRCDRHRSGHADGVAGGPFKPAGDRLCLRRRRLAASGQSADAGVSPICSAHPTSTASSGGRRALPGTTRSGRPVSTSRRTPARSMPARSSPSRCSASAWCADCSGRARFASSPWRWR